jgi:hypothetical protein
MQPTGCFTVVVAVLLTLSYCYGVSYTTLGMPIVLGPLPAESWSIFAISIIENRLEELNPTDSLYFGLTQFIGDADMYISTTREPNTTLCGHCIINATSSYHELKSISRDSIHWPTNGTFYVGIYCNTQSEFSFNAWTQNTNSTLNNGEPQVGLIGNTYIKFYEFLVPYTSSFTLSIHSRANVTLFVTTRSDIRPVDVQTSTWTSYGTVNSVIQISETDPNFITGKYYIGVKSHGAEEEEFSLFAVLKHNYTRMTVGDQLHGKTVNSTMLFMYDVPSDYTGRQITFSLTSASNTNPHMYITRSVETAAPGPNNCDWCRVDTQTIAEAEEGCYYIAVTGEQDTYFQLSVLTEQLSIEIFNANRTSGYVSSGEYACYRFLRTTTQESLVFTVMPLIANSVELYDSKELVNPTPTKHDSMGHDDSGGRTIVHDAGQESDSTWYYLAVQGMQDTNFTILAYNMSYTHLETDIVAYSQKSQAYTWKYFTYDISDEDTLKNTVISITAVPLRLSMRLELFASDSTPQPTRSKYTWQSRRSTTNNNVFLNINTIDKRLRNKRIYVGLYSSWYQLETINTITFNVAVSKATNSLPRQPMVVTQLGNPIIIPPTLGITWSHFMVHQKDFGLDALGTNERIYFTLTPTSGDADMFISGTTFVTSSDPCTHCIATSKSYFDDAVDLWSGDTKYYVGDTLYVSVFAFSQVEFALNVFSSRTSVPLTNGIPQIASSTPSMVTFYEYSLNQTSDITISLSTREATSFDLFVTTNENVRPVDASSAMWRCNTLSSDCVITINTNEPNYKSKYFIGVKSVGNKIYSIIASTLDTYSSIVGSVPITQTVLRDQPRLFMFKRTSRPSTVTITEVRNNVVVYITRDISQQPPGPNNFIWRDTDVGDRTIEIASGGVGAYYIAVYCTDAESALFRIGVISQWPSTSLTSGVTVQSQSVDDEYQYFQFYNANPDNQNVRIIVSPINEGNFALFESTTYTHPSELKYHSKGSTVGNNSYIYHPETIQGTPTTYYLSVKVDNGTKYTVTAQVNKLVTKLQLNAGLSNLYLFADQYRYFYYDMDPSDFNNHTEITFLISRQIGMYALWASVTNEYPTKHEWTWQSDALSLTLSTLDTKFGEKRRVYLAVLMYSDRSVGSFSIDVYREYPLPTTMPPTKFETTATPFPTRTPRPTRPPPTTVAPTKPPIVTVSPFERFGVPVIVVIAIVLGIVLFTCGFVIGYELLARYRYKTRYYRMEEGKPTTGLELETTEEL